MGNLLFVWLDVLKLVGVVLKSINRLAHANVQNFLYQFIVHRLNSVFFSYFFAELRRQTFRNDLFVLLVHVLKDEDSVCQERNDLIGYFVVLCLYFSEFILMRFDSRLCFL